MELKEIIILIRHRLLFLICIPVIMAVITALICTTFIQPVYEASSTLYIVNKKSLSEELITYEEILANQDLVKDYRELIKSKFITTTVINELKIIDISPNQLSDRITVNSKNDTRVLEIKITDHDPQRAKNITNTVCTIFIKKAPTLINQHNIQVVDEATKPTSPILPKTLQNTILSFLISLLCVFGIFYLLEIVNETIKTSEDIENYLGLKVLGTIPSFQTNRRNIH